MQPRLWALLESIAGLLDRDERQSVLGDISERGATWSGALDLIGLVLLRQLQAWTSWQPWEMAALLAISTRSVGFATHPIAYIARTGHLLQFGTFLIQPWVVVGAMVSAWAIGFTLGRIGQRRSASLLLLLIGISSWYSYQTALSSLRLELPPTWTTRFQLDYTAAQHIASAVQLMDESSRFIAAVIVMNLIIALPFVHGWYRGLHQRPLPVILTLAGSITAIAARGVVVPSNVSAWRFWFFFLMATWPLVYTLWAAVQAPRIREPNRVIHNV